MAADVIAELAGARLAFDSRVLWDHLDLTLRAGEFIAVLGPNGTGKTSLLKVLLGELPLNSGTVTVAGRPVTDGSEQIGYVPQHRAVDPGLTLRGRDMKTCARFSSEPSTSPDKPVKRWSAAGTASIDTKLPSRKKHSAEAGSLRSTPPAGGSAASPGRKLLRTAALSDRFCASAVTTCSTAPPSLHESKTRRVSALCTKYGATV